MRMNKRSRFLVSVVERYSKSISFLVSRDFYHMEAVESRLVWISELDYEVSEAEIDNYAKVLLEIPKHVDDESFSSSETRIGKKMKSVVKIADESKLECEHERMSIQRALEDLQKDIPDANFDSSTFAVENLRGMINSLKDYFS